MVNDAGFLMHAYDKRLVVFSIRESRQTKKPGNVSGCQVAAVLRSQGTQERFRLTCVEPFDAPHDLMFAGRSVENEVRWRHVAGSTDGLKRGTCLLVEVEICVADFTDLFFGPV